MSLLKLPRVPEGIPQTAPQSRLVKQWSDAPLPFQCGTLYLPCSAGHAVIAERHPLLDVFHRRPLAFAASAMASASAISFSGEKCAQKKVTQ
jgi:hypothetical protein